MKQFACYIANAIINGDEKLKLESTNIIKKHFVKDSELYKELKLFKALVEYNAPSETIAYRIIEEARRACANHDYHKIEHQKSMLIKDINYKLGCDTFYNQKINNYKLYATIQTCLNHWRKGNERIDKIVEYEKSIVENLCVDKLKVIEEGVKIDKIDDLTVHLMTKKLSEKYMRNFSQKQFRIFDAYAIQQNYQKTQNILLETKENALHSLNSYHTKCNNIILNNKFSDVLVTIESLDIQNIDDTNISRALILCDLIDELTDKK